MPMKLFFLTSRFLLGPPLLVVAEWLRGGVEAQDVSGASYGQPPQVAQSFSGPVPESFARGIQQPVFSGSVQPSSLGQAAAATGYSLPQVRTQLLQAENSPAPAMVYAPSAPPPTAHLEPAHALPKQGECWCKDDSSCSVSKVTVRQDHYASGGISLADVSAIWGNSALSQEQRQKVTLGKVSETSLLCMDDRVEKASIFTPGGDLGEFILGLSSYLQERDPTGSLRPTQQVVDALLMKYLETIPSSRPMVHCTDDRAIQHLEAEAPLENLDLRSPPDHAKASLLKQLTEVENHGDSHIRLLLKKPEWFQLSEYLVPMAVKSFYTLLWQQNSDARSPLYKAPKLNLEVLVGQSDPTAFLEVASSDLCHSGGVAPMLIPRSAERSVLISHLDAVSHRREELASFFTRVANASPRKINKDQLHQRMDRHGWLALEETGSRIAASLPFYTLTYS